jgi:hypothetical protein
VKLRALALAAGLVACAPAHGPTVIVGATALSDRGHVPDSVIILDGPTVAALGTRVETAIPKGARLVDGRGAYAVAPGSVLAVGRAADFLLVADPARLDNPRAVVRGGRVEILQP